jgi:hypothetical protein
MKNLFIAVCSIVCLMIGCTSSSDNEYYSYAFLKNDFDQVAVVASITVQDVAAVDRMGPRTGGAGYVRYRIRCRVIESFKGAVKAGETIVYYSVAEQDYDPSNYRGDKIVFLNKGFDKRKKESMLTELENSSRSATKEVLNRMKKIKAEPRGNEE